VRFIDENMGSLNKADYLWVDAVFMSGMYAQRVRIVAIDEAAHKHGNWRCWAVHRYQVVQSTIRA
jgi:hypothetical protein